MTLRELLAAEGYDVLSGTKVVDYSKLKTAVSNTLSSLYDFVEVLSIELGMTTQEVWDKVIAPDIKRDRDLLVKTLNKLSQWTNVDEEIGQQRRRLERKWLSRY